MYTYILLTPLRDYRCCLVHVESPNEFWLKRNCERRPNLIIYHRHYYHNVFPEEIFRLTANIENVCRADRWRHRVDNIAQHRYNFYSCRA